MTDPLERLHTPISGAELERRWAAVRSAMEREGLDALVMQNNNDHMGGAVKWFTDHPAVNGYPYTVLFYRDGGMTVVRHGPIGGDLTADPTLRGVDRILTTASFVSAAYTAGYDGGLAGDDLAGHGARAIGLVCPGQMSTALSESLRQRLPHAAFVEASDLVARIATVKSAEERELIRGTTALQDRAMQAVVDAIAPGMRESDVAAVALHASQLMGSEQGIYLTASGRPSEALALAPRHMQHRVLREGDVLWLLIENNGPGGMYSELGRMFVLGEPPAPLQAELAFAAEAQAYCASLLVDGAASADVWHSYNAYLREHGRGEERRIHCHGQGYDLVERPLIRFDDPDVVRAHTNLACHPDTRSNGASAWLCDNYLVQESGPPEHLHAFPAELIVV